MNSSLIVSIRQAEARLRPALVAARAREGLRARVLDGLRWLEPVWTTPLGLRSGSRFYLPSRIAPNSKAVAVIDELMAAGVARGAIASPRDSWPRRVARLVLRLPQALALRWWIARRHRRLDRVHVQIVLGHLLYRKLLRRHPGVVPIVISDVSPDLHMLWSAAAREGNRALWWQDDYHHFGPLVVPIGMAAVLNGAGVEAALACNPMARVMARPQRSCRAIRSLPSEPLLGIATNADFRASEAEVALIDSLRKALGVREIVLRLHPNSALHGRAEIAGCAVAPIDETLECFAARIDLAVVGNSASQLRLLREGVPVLHVAGLDGNGFDLYGYVAEGICAGARLAAQADAAALQRHYADPLIRARAARLVELENHAELPGLAQLALSVAPSDGQ